MSELKRYKLGSLHPGTGLLFDREGEWCRYEDVERVLNVLGEQVRRESVERIEAQRKLQLYTEEFSRDHNEMVAEVDAGRIRRAELHQQLDEAEALRDRLHAFVNRCLSFIALRGYDRVADEYEVELKEVLKGLADD